MSDGQPSPGTIGWIDLTVDNAAEVREFYEQVAGWASEPVDMGDYEDFTMKADADAEAEAGICHARGGNLGLPAQWLIYITVGDLEGRLRRVVELGGQVVRPPGELGGMGRFAVIRDPAGAVAALFEPNP